MPPVKIERELKARLWLEVLACFDLPVAEKHSMFPVIHVLMYCLHAIFHCKHIPHKGKNGEKMR